MHTAVPDPDAVFTAQSSKTKAFVFLTPAGVGCAIAGMGTSKQTREAFKRTPRPTDHEVAARALAHAATHGIYVPDIGANATALLRHRGITQRAAAERCGMNLCGLQRSMAGLRPFRAQELYLFAEHMGVPVELLFSHSFKEDLAALVKREAA